MPRRNRWLSGGNGPVIEYVVKMHEFPQLALLDRALARGDAGAATIRELAYKIAAFHAAFANSVNI